MSDNHERSAKLGLPLRPFLRPPVSPDDVGGLMSNTRDDGGPAFPQRWRDAGSDMTGLSLRDYFAAKAMLAEMITTFSDATPKAATAFAQAAAGAGHTPEYHLAVNAYRVADAMLLARKETR